jgi:hypothetical protein
MNDTSPRSFGRIASSTAVHEGIAGVEVALHPEVTELRACLQKLLHALHFADPHGLRVTLGVTVQHANLVGTQLVE